ncbi:MAG TPA: CUAEP/CCAEP-tail radical SAM protein [Acidimicrobiales bacterium]|nr:CUAEP/CCAEP-tail radical SAM protein [Acidimicrobiales bacterium]
MRVLLVSGYELGHQPLQVASPAAVLHAAGHEVRTVDLSLAPLEPDAVGWADCAALSVPMHTATRLAVSAADSIRRIRPRLPVCAYGLYAGVLADEGTSHLVDQTIAGEYETELLRWVDAVAAGRRALPTAHVVTITREPHRAPRRDAMAPLDRYARLRLGPQEKLVGYTEASHGCSHRCRHCPVPVVYAGRVRPVDLETVLADVDQLVDAGAEHVTFGDPDFLNAPRHSLRVVDEVHRRHPGLTFDATIKVEHLLRQEEAVEILARSGLLFVVSAFESVDDDILARLDKGHTAAESSRAVHLLRRLGVEVRPSWLPFTPWTTVETVVRIVDFVAGHDIVPNVDTVQYSIRLLVPPGSLLLDDDPDWARPFDPDALGHPWVSSDPRVDALQARLAETAAGATDLPPEEAFLLVHSAVTEAARDAGVEPPREVPAPTRRVVPGLSEAWFCCAEPPGVGQACAVGQGAAPPLRGSSSAAGV